MMHELSLVSSVIDSIERMAAQEHWGKIERVTLRIGTMRQVVPQIMQFAYRSATEGTALQNSQLNIEPVPIAICCRACGGRWGEEKMGLLCPFCGSDDTEMEHGMELDIDSVEVNEDGETEN